MNELSGILDDLAGLIDLMIAMLQCITFKFANVN